MKTAQEMVEECLKDPIWASLGGLKITEVKALFEMLHTYGAQVKEECAKSIEYKQGDGWLVKSIIADWQNRIREFKLP